MNGTLLSPFAKCLPAVRHTWYVLPSGVDGMFSPSSLDAEMSYYIFSVAKLGWINCDIFVESEEKIDLLAEMPVSPNTQLKMVFRDINGVLKPIIKEDKYVFAQVPKGKQATIVGMRRENGRLLAAFKPLTIGEESIRDLKFSEITLNELKEKLDNI